MVLLPALELVSEKNRKCNHILSSLIIFHSEVHTALSVTKGDDFPFLCPLYHFHECVVHP